MLKLSRKAASLLRWAETRFISNVADDGKPPDPRSSEISSLLQENLVSSFQTRQKIDPDDTNILLFPGQGSQTIGMANDLLQYPNVKEMFDVASDILNFGLLNYCQNGPKSELDRTVHCQPAVMVTSLACVEKLQAMNPWILEHCYAAAGYSVGEFAALVFSGALTFEDAVKLIGIRSRAMETASDTTGSRMVTAIGGSKSRFKDACFYAKDHCVKNLAMDEAVCTVSAYLCPNMVTMAGHNAAIEYLENNKQRFNIKRIIPIPVSGAFHTKLMSNAAAEMRTALSRVDIQKPIIRVYSNLTGKPYSSPIDIRAKLPEQIIKPVKWEQTIHQMLSRSPDENMPNIYEVEPGSHLGTFIKKCNGKAWKNYTLVKNMK